MKTNSLENKFEQKANKRQDLHEEIEIPEGIIVSIENNELIMKKDNSELKRRLNPVINVKIKGGKLILESKKANKKEKKILGTMKSHFNNMIKGLNEKFKYKLQVASVHFPIIVSVDKEKNELIVKNFLGEKKDRRIKLASNINIKVDKNIIEVESADIEAAGQCAANIEKGTKIRNRDRRVYGDGIYITEKPGREFT